MLASKQFRVVAGVLSAVVLCSVATSGRTQQPTSAPTQRAAPANGGVASGMGQLPPKPAERLAAAFSEIGLTACAGVAQRAGNFLFEDGEAAFTVQPLGPNANAWPTVISIESRHPPAGQTRFSTITISPGAGCSGAYEQVIVWPKRCDELARTVFSDFTANRPLLSQVQVSELNAGLQLYLMPHQGGRGCTSIKRELFR